MKHLLILVTLLLVSKLALADALTDLQNHNNDDHFQWTVYDNDVHLLAGYSLSLTGGLLLEHKLGLSRLQSALVATTLVGMFGTAKEVFHDNYTSRTDIKTWWGGAAAGGFTLMVFKF